MKLRQRFEELDARRDHGDLLTGRWELSRADALERSRRAAAYMAAKGLRPGDTIAVGVRDDAEVTALFLACLRCGVVPIFVDPGATAAEVAQLLAAVEVRWMLADGSLVDRWVCDQAALRYPVQRVTGAAKKSLLARWKSGGASADAGAWPACLEAHAGAAPPDYTPAPDDLALILYTSGTSGGPKLVPLSRRNLAAQATTMTRGLEVDETARVLNLMPITHVDGLLTGILVSFWSGAAMVRLEPFTIPGLPTVLDAIYKHRVTHAVLVPTLLSLMLRDEAATREAFATQDFRCVISTAASLGPELWERFETVTGKPVANMFGMSEVGNVIFAGPAEATRVRGTIGAPIDVSVRIESDEGQTLGCGERGELLIAGESVTPGYLGQPTPWRERDGVRWFPTGDLAVRDERGLLTLVGRKKDLIITGGNNVAPDEVNRALLAHPAVVEAATFGLPDDTWGERIVACAVMEDGASPDEVLRFVATRLAAFKVPRELHRVEELPKGRSGKVQVAELARRVSEGAQGERPVEEVVLDLAARCFRTAREALDLGTSPDTCESWDSMAHLDFVVGLERAFGLRFGPREVMRMRSLSVVAEMVRGRRADAT